MQVKKSVKTKNSQCVLSCSTFVSMLLIFCLLGRLLNSLLQNIEVQQDNLNHQFVFGKTKIFVQRPYN